MSLTISQMLSDQMPSGDGGVSEVCGSTNQQTPISRTALAMDKWSMQRGERIASEWEQCGIAHHDSIDVADAHAALFEPTPTLAENAEDKRRAAWFKQLLDTPEYKAVHDTTCLNTAMSAIACKAIADEYVRYVDSQPNDQSGNQADQAEHGGESEDIGQTVARLRSVANAVQKTAEDAATAQSTAAGLGIGTGSPLDQQRLASAFQSIRKSDLLKKIFAWAGRGRRIAQSKQRAKLTAKRGEITGIKLGGDYTSLVTSERLALCGALGDGPRELAEIRFLGKRAMCYQRTKPEPVALGPIVVGIDESGSMNGDRIIAAKGIALTLAWVARQQNRWLCLYSFCTELVGQPLVLKPGDNHDQQLMAWLSQFRKGGTELVASLQTIPETWPQLVAQGLIRGKTDHIVITDACLSANDNLVADYKSWAAAERVTTYGVVIGKDEPGDIQKFCNQFWCLKELSESNEATDAIFSL